MKAAEVKPEAEKAAVVSEPVVDATPCFSKVVEDSKPEAAAVESTPSVVKDIPLSKAQSEAFVQASKLKDGQETPVVSSTDEIEKEYQNEINKPA